MNLESERPLWSFGDVVVVTFAFIAYLFLFSIITVLVAISLPHFRGMTSQQVAQDLTVALLAQVFAYLALLWTISRVVKRRAEHVNRFISFAAALRWNPPLHRPIFVMIGIAVAAVVEVSGRFLPIPPSLPIDQAFSTTSSAYVMSIFGVVIAPLIEEVYFRGLFFPAIAQLMRGVGERFAMWSAIALTGAFFAFIHAPQVDYAWAPLLMIFAVGVVLTLVRARTRSVAASWLVHVGYNATLMLLVFIETNGFRRLDLMR